MQKTVIAMSSFVLSASASADVDYWVMQGVLGEQEVNDRRAEGFAVTVFDAIPDDDDSLLQTIAMAMLHTAIGVN